VVLGPGSVEVSQGDHDPVRRWTPAGATGEWESYGPVWLESTEAAWTARRLAQAWLSTHNESLLIGAMPSEESGQIKRLGPLVGRWVNGNTLRTSSRVIPMAARNGGFMAGKRKDKWQGNTWNDWWTRTSSNLRNTGR